jgi:photosystem II stability/assembly factor-like uncharacterized protein
MKKYLLSVMAGMLVASASAQWQVQNAGFTNDTLGFYEMSLPNAHTAWAICYDGKPGTGLARGRFILDFTRTTNGGATWTPGKMGTDHTLQFANISAVSESEAWIAVNKRNTGGGGLYHTIDSGITWTQSNAGVIFDAASFPNFVHFKDSSHGIAMGDPNVGYFEIYTTVDGGKNWGRVDSADLPTALSGEYGWISGFAAVGNTIWFGTTVGRMYKTVDFGKTWSVSTVDPTGKFVMEIAFNDDGLHGVAHLRDNNSQTFLYSTSDGGLTWTNLGKPANWKSSRITAVPGTKALIATSVNGFDLGSSISYDNGATWKIIDNAVPKAVCRFYNEHIGYAGGFFVAGPPVRGGIYKSTIVFEHPELAVTTGLQSAEAIKIYPSPANDVINISLKEDQVNSPTMIYVLSTEGKILESKSSTGVKVVQLNVDGLAPGMYMIRVASGNGVVSRLITVSR